MKYSDNVHKKAWWETGCWLYTMMFLDLVALCTYVAGSSLIGFYNQDMIMAFAPIVGGALIIGGHCISAISSYKIKIEESRLIECSKLKNKIEELSKSDKKLQDIFEKSHTIDVDIVNHLRTSGAYQCPHDVSFCKWGTIFLAFCIPSFGLLTGLCSKNLFIAAGFKDMYSIAQLICLISVSLKSLSALKSGTSFIKYGIDSFNEMNLELKEMCSNFKQPITSKNLKEFLSAKYKTLTWSFITNDVYRQLLTINTSAELQNENKKSPFVESAGVFFSYMFFRFEHSHEYKEHFVYPKMMSKMIVKTDTIRNIKHQFDQESMFIFSAKAKFKDINKDVDTANDIKKENSQLKTYDHQEKYIETNLLSLYTNDTEAKGDMNEDRQQESVVIGDQVII